MIKRYWLIALLFLSLSCQCAPTDPLLSIDVNQVPTRALLINLARFSHKNVIISPNIQGEMSIHLDHVPLSQIIQFIIQSQQLNYQQWGTVSYISPLTEATPAPINDQSPLQRVYIALRYVKANDMLVAIKTPESHLLSARGSISADSRTNSLWIEDTSSKIHHLQNLLKHLDQNSPQIAITARIVTVDIFHERDLGLQFGLSSLHHLSGTLEGANEAQKNGIGTVPVKARLNVDFAANPSDAASIGVALLPLQAGYRLDLALSALEANGFGDIIASPHLLTTNGQTASIETGEDIPYQEKTSSGATNVAFKKAVLSLSVTPQILNRQQMLLTLKISQDKASSREVNGVPAIDTREIITQVFVNNGQTVVLGGIYEIDQQQVVKRIPFISDIPFIGRLFSYQHQANQKRELLIFIRPTLVNN